MFQMTKEDALNTLKNYSMLMSRVKEVVNEIGFLDKEFDTLDINKTHFTKDSVHVVAYDGHYDLYDSVSCKFPLEFLFEPAEMHKDWYRKKCEAEEKKKQAELMATVAVGDSVLTSSGFYGVIIDMTDDTVIVEFGSNKNCRIPMRKDAIVQVEKPEV